LVCSIRLNGFALKGIGAVAMEFLCAKYAGENLANSTK
jgi:hypothetical protein